ncbi:MAG: HIT family protein [Leadbetterella sp.]|nr:HIT family protein [Leadbetterella sp.]
MATIFGKIVAGEIPAHKIAENEEFLAFLDVFPCHEGHTLVIPKKETDYLFDLDDDAYTRLFAFAKTLEPALKKAVPCTKVGLAVVGLEVPHVHVHLVPMDHISDMDFTSKLKVSQEELAATAERIRAFL